MSEQQEIERLRRRIQHRQLKLIHDLREGITELLPYIDDVEALQTIYAHTLAAFYNEGKDVEYYLKELRLSNLTVVKGKQ